MKQGRDGFERLVAGLAEDPAFSAFVRADSAILVWDRHGDCLLWASAAAGDLRAALTDESGCLDGASPVRARLRALGQGLAPSRGARLERIRLDPNRLAPPVTCACRLVRLDTAEEVLVLAILGPLPKFSARPAPAPVPAPPAAEAAVGDADAAGSTPQAPAEPDLANTAAADAGASGPAANSASRLEGRGTVRFLWRADRDGRFTEVSGNLAEVVGSGSAAVIGRTWTDIASALVEDPAGAVAELFARHEAWSGRTVLWRVDDCSLAVPVDLAGMPIHDRERRLAGFRGFGLIRTDAVVERPWPRGQTGNREADTAAAPAVRAGLDDARGGPGDLSGRPEDVRGASAAVPDVDHVVDGSDAIALPLDPGAAEAQPQPTPEAHAALPLAPEASAEAAAPLFPLADAGGPGEQAGEASALIGSERFAPRHGDPVARLDGAQTGETEAAAPDNPPAPERTGEAERRGSASRLSGAERSAFREIARALGARFEGDEAGEPRLSPPAPAEIAPLRPPPAPDPEGRRILDRLPAGILVHRGEEPLFANRALLDLVGYDSIESIAADGGVGRLFQGRTRALARFEDAPSPVALLNRAKESVAVEIRLTNVEWAGFPASLMLVRKVPDADPADRLRALELELRAAEARLSEVSAILDTATDGVIVMDEAGRILSLNRSAEALFGYDQNEVTGDPLAVLLAPESHALASEYLAGLRANGVASLLNDGREVLGRVRQGGTIPLFLTVGRIANAPDRKFCAVLRDITAFKKAEGELAAAKRAAEDSNAQRADFLAKISHEVRTPLGAIVGFAEVMLEERFGPVGNERYKDYLRDIHDSGGHVVRLVNDLLDLAKIQAGRMELAFTAVDLNRLVGSCVASLQPQAARGRIVMRVGLAAKLPPVVADERSIRQIALNIIANAIQFTDAGGQVIVSTAVTDRGEVAIRVRDTGIGMTGEEVEAALKPFRQLSTANRGGGTGLGLPLTKALVEANRGVLAFVSAPGEGTLVEVLFPPTRVLAR